MQAYVCWNRLDFGILNFQLYNLHVTGKKMCSSLDNGLIITLRLWYINKTEYSIGFYIPISILIDSILYASSPSIEAQHIFYLPFKASVF